MRKNNLKMLTCGRACSRSTKQTSLLCTRLIAGLTAIMICGFTVTAMSACSSDDDNKTETPQEQTVKMFYVVEVSDDVLKVADVEVNYVDQTGAKQKEVMTSKKWIKALDTNTLPLTEGLWARITPKSAVASGNYQLKVITVAGYEAKLANGASSTAMAPTPTRLPLLPRLLKRWLPGAPRALLWALPSARKAMPNRHQWILEEIPVLLLIFLVLEYVNGFVAYLATIPIDVSKSGMTI